MIFWRDKYYRSALNKDNGFLQHLIVKKLGRGESSESNNRWFPKIIEEIEAKKKAQQFTAQPTQATTKSIIFIN